MKGFVSATAQDEIASWVRHAKFSVQETRCEAEKSAETHLELGDGALLVLKSNTELDGGGGIGTSMERPIFGLTNTAEENTGLGTGQHGHQNGGTNKLVHGNQEDLNAT
jgi:hypothetical protein